MGPGGLLCPPALPNHLDTRWLQPEPGEPGWAMYSLNTESRQTSSGQAPPEGTLQPLPKHLAASRCCRMWGTEAPWVHQGSGGRVISEQLHLLPFHWAATPLPARHHSMETALGCWLCSGDSTASLGLFPLLSLAVMGCGERPPPSQSAHGGMDRQWDGMAAGQAPLRDTEAGSELGTLFGESSHPRDTRQDTQPARPKEQLTGHPSCHPTLDWEPGLNTLPEEQLHFPKKRKPMCQSHGLLPSEGGENLQVLLPIPLYGSGGSAPHPGQHHHSSHSDPAASRGSSSRTRISSSPTGGLAGFPHKALSRPQDPQDGVEALKSPTLCVLVCVTPPQSHQEEETHHSQPLISLLSHPHPHSTSAGLGLYLSLHWQNSTHETLGTIISPLHKSPHPSPALLAARTSQGSSHIPPCPVELPRATPTLGNLQDLSHSCSSVRCVTIHCSTPHTRVGVPLLPSATVGLWEQGSLGLSPNTA